MTQPTASDWQELLEFTASLLNETTPRALIIIGAARLEEETKEIVSVVAPGFESDRKSHGSRIELLLALGHLTEKASRCLRHITKIRNYFAHTSAPCSLSDAAIQKDVNDLFQELAHLNLSEAAEGFFGTLLSKIPNAPAPHTWLDDKYKRYQIAVTMLKHHLRVVRCNLPKRTIPVELSQPKVK